MQKKTSLKALIIMSPILIVLTIAIVILVTRNPAEQIPPDNHSNTQTDPTRAKMGSELLSQFQAVEGITLRTELEYYPEGTQRIQTTWENASEYNAMYGDSFFLERYNEQNSSWESVYIDSPDSVYFHSIGRILANSHFSKHTYNINYYIKDIKEGTYRIVATYHVDADEYETTPEQRNAMQGSVSAQFKITADTSLHKPSELDYAYLDRSEELMVSYNYKSYELGRAITPVHVYKNLALQNTDLVIDGKVVVQLADGMLNQSVDSPYHYISPDGGQYILYILRDQSKIYTTQYVIYDVINKNELMRSETYENYTLYIADAFHLGDNVFKLYTSQFEEVYTPDTAKGYISSKNYELVYENGSFTLAEENERD